MVDYVKTFTNSLNVYGASEANRWNSLVFGTDNWGTTEDLPLVFEKGIFNTLATTSTVGKDILHGYNNSLDMSSTVGKDFSRFTTNSMGVSNTMTSIHVQNDGFYVVWPGDTINFLDRVQTSFTLKTTDSSAWSETSFTTTTWS